MDKSPTTTRIELAPLSARPPHLGVQLQALGYPMLGVALYAPEAVLSSAPRLLLHACKLQFIHPVSGSWMELQSDPDF